MAENQVALETKGIKRALKGFSVYDAISEYIWNGFDAGATKIAINFQENDLHGIERVSISDNGCGISKETLLLKFTPVFDSNKATLNPAGSKNSSITHGKNGVGRFTFFTFSEKAVWSTVYADGDKHYRYSIEIQCDTLDNFIDRVREQSLDEMISVIYSAEPKIFSNLNITQQKTLIRLFDMSMQSGEIENLYAVLEGVMDMSSEDRADLAGLLKYTNLSNITKTIAIIKDRLEVIQKLKYLVLDEERYSTEIDHIQPFIEKNYWIFGEQYYLVTAEEPDFEEALRRYLYVLRGEVHPKGTIHIDSMHRQKEMDIFAVQRRLDGTVKKCIVVELKRPSKVLGSKELQQVKNYFSVIDGESRFNAPNIDWEFFLVGNDYNKEIADEIESARHHGERSLVFSVGRKKIYVKKWSEIFTEHEINLNFLHEKLAIKQEELIKTFSGMSPDKVAVSENTATMPPEVQVG